MQGCLGVVGGMGPLVSAEFVRTIYELGIRGREQDSPRVLLYSDPTFPDRTTAIAEGREQTLVQPLTTAIQFLLDAGAARVVICCVTVHQVLPAVAPQLRQRIRSLIDVVVDELAASNERHLMLASTGTRRSRLFERNERWSAVSDRVVLPDDADQDRIHQSIYRLKSNEDVEHVLPLVDELTRKYGVRSFIAGCTEMHFIAKRLGTATAPQIGAVDPLLVIARELADGAVRLKADTTSSV